MKRPVRQRCPDCHVAWQLPPATVDIVHLPNETAWLWWTCPDCHTHHHTDITALWALHRDLEHAGVRVLDWSLFDDDIDQPPCTLAQSMRMQILTWATSTVVQAAMVEACEQILRAADR